MVGIRSYDSPVEFPNWRELVFEEVGHFIDRIEKFKETKEQIQVCFSIVFPKNLF